MTTETFPTEINYTADGLLAGLKAGIVQITNFVGYSAIFIVYASIFAISLLTVGFVEIRQANMVAFNSLIATLEQRDRYQESDINQILRNIRDERAEYTGLLAAPLVCPTVANSPLAKGQDGQANNSEAPTDLNTETAKFKTCKQIGVALENHFNALLLAEDDTIFKKAYAETYYEQYIDGITKQAPQIIPALKLVDKSHPWLILWGRSPFELIEMFLLVCMGLLGGMIGVMRCFVDRSLPNPSVLDIFYKPAAGAVIALGVFVLFRATQLFLGVDSRGGAGTGSTSIFLLAGLGLASGFCANEAVKQIEYLAMRIFRSGNATVCEAAATSALPNGRQG